MSCLPFCEPHWPCGSPVAGSHVLRNANKSITSSCVDKAKTSQVKMYGDKLPSFQTKVFWVVTPCSIAVVYQPFGWPLLCIVVKTLFNVMDI